MKMKSLNCDCAATTILFLILALTTVTLTAPASKQLKNETTGAREDEEHVSVTRFREYLQCKAMHPEPDYNSSIAWIKNQALEIGLEYKIIEFEPPFQLVVVLKWPGINQNLPSILLNSHMDVVPVEEEKWTYPPFSAHKDENGNIYARGSQDMKSVGVQYLEAIRNLKAQGVSPLRNVYVTYCPDEELGGKRGMKHFVETEEFKNLNVGFGLDEGTASQDDKFYLMWTERSIWQVEFIAEGQAGHGSILYGNTAAEKFEKVLAAMLKVRESEKERMEENGLDLGDVTTINLTLLKGGTQINVVPSELSMSFDIRITPYWNHSIVQEILDNVTMEVGGEGGGVTYNILRKSDPAGQTLLTPDNVWWTAVQNFASETGIQLYPTIMPGGTDIKYLREVGIPAFGFSPMNQTPKLAHDHNEFLNEEIFLRGILLYEQLLSKLFNLVDNGSKRV